jgi:photosystem II stability/assembly factor-like uncharacterized protein
MAADRLLRLSLVLTLIWAGQSSRAVEGASGKWTTGGPQAGNVLSVVIDSRDSKLLYAGTDGAGVFRSDDGGSTWHSTELNGGTIIALAIDSSRSGTLYAATPGGLFKTADGGDSWRPINEGLLDLSVEALAIDPGNPNNLYVGVSDVDRPEASGLYRSTNGGEHWERTSLSGGIYAVTVDPTSSRILYASPYALSRFIANRSRGISKSIDGGDTWTTNPSPGGGLVAPSPIVVDPLNPSNVYAGWIDGFFFRSGDGGANWELRVFDPSGHIPGAPQILSLAIDPSLPGTLYAGTQRNLLKTTDGGQTWTPLPGVNGSVDALAIDSLNPSRVFAGLGLRNLGRAFAFPLLRTEDGGSTWSEAGLGITNAIITGLAVDPSAPFHVVATVHVSQLWDSRDSGTTWSRIETNATEDLQAVAIDPSSSTTLYAGAYMGSSCLGLRVSRDSGRTWGATGLTVGCVTRIVFDPSDPRVIYVVHNAGIFESTDAGTTWTSASLIQFVQALAIDPRSSQRLYAGTLQAGVLVSVDRGFNWSTSNSGLPVNAQVPALVVGPADSPVLFAAVDSVNPTTGTVYKSLDAGRTWLPAGAGLDSSLVNALAIDPANPRRIFAGTDSGVFASMDAGTSWFRFSWGLPITSVRSLRFGAPGGPLFAGTPAWGIFDYEFPQDRPPVATTTRKPEHAREIRPR